MVKLIVLFRQTDVVPPNYEQNYNDFLILVDKLPGMVRKSVSTVYSGPGGFVPYRAVIEAFFETPGALQAALTSAAGIDAGNALINFAGADAITIFAEVMEENYPQA